MDRAEKRRRQKEAQKEAQKAAKKGNAGQAETISSKPPELTTQQTLGLALRHHMAGRTSEAENLYRQILKTDPDQPDALHLLGVLASEMGNNGLAVDLITKALAIKPDNAEAHNNLGIAFEELGKLDEAIASYQKAIATDPGFAEAEDNLGNAFKNLGMLENAVAAFQKALAIAPDFAEAHNNLGNALNDLGRLEDAAASFQKALAINPDYAEARHNLHGLLLDPDDMAPAIECLEKAVELNPDHMDFRFKLGVLLEYSGDAKTAEKHFEFVETGENSDKAKLDAWRYLKSANETLPLMTGSNIQAFGLGMDAAPKDGLVIEFGVRFGTSIRQIAALADQDVHGFDSFEGLPEAWHNEPKGSYSTDGVKPSVPDNVTLHQGWFEDTLPDFVKNHQDPVRFMNVDCDIYSSTKTVLDLLSGQIIPGTVIVYDEYIGNETWRDDEFKAFQEAVQKHGWKYDYLGFSFMTKQVVVRIK